MSVQEEQGVVTEAVSSTQPALTEERSKVNEGFSKPGKWFNYYRSFEAKLCIRMRDKGYRANAVMISMEC